MPNPASAAPTIDPKTTASNIANGIKDRANGKAPGTPPSAGADAKATSPADVNAGKKMYKVDGQEVWLSPDEADTWVQKAMGYEKKLTKMGHLQQEVTQLQRDLLTNPGKVLANVAKQANVPMKDIVQRVLSSDASDDVKASVGQWYWETVVEPQKLSPEQLEARENKKKVTQYEQEKQQAAERAVQAENKQRADRLMAEAQGFIGQAMKETGMPNIDGPDAVLIAKLVADRWRLSYRTGQPITPKQAVEYAFNTLDQYVSAKWDALDDENFIKRFGEKRVDRVKKYLLKLVKDTKDGSFVQKGDKPASRPGQRKTITPDDMHDMLDQMKKENRII